MAPSCSGPSAGDRALRAVVGLSWALSVPGEGLAAAQASGAGTTETQEKASAQSLRQLQDFTWPPPQCRPSLSGPPCTAPLVLP